MVCHPYAHFDSSALANTFSQAQHLSNSVAIAFCHTVGFALCDSVAIALCDSLAVSF